MSVRPHPKKIRRQQRRKALFWKYLTNDEKEEHRKKLKEARESKTLGGLFFCLYNTPLELLFGE